MDSREMTPDLFVINRTSRRLSRHERMVLCRLIDVATGRDDRPVDASLLSDALAMREKLTVVRRRSR